LALPPDARWWLCPTAVTPNCFWGYAPILQVLVPEGQTFRTSGGKAANSEGPGHTPPNLTIC
jgi:hypothetical protein